MTKRIPAHDHRPRDKQWTDAQRIRHAQISSMRQRPPAKITLPKEPWHKENNNGPDNSRL